VSNRLFEPGKVELKFADGPTATAYELSNYLYYLKVMYTHLHDDYESTDELFGGTNSIIRRFNSQEERIQLSERVRASIRARELNTASGRYGYFVKNLGGRDIHVVSITSESPTKIVILGLISLITIAAIVSGGSIHLGFTGVEAELAPLGEGLQTLKNLF